jgi:gamma-glutamyltranspeptidase / glutathione hydrolase
VLALGSPGAFAQINAIVQVIVAVLDHGLSPQEAVCLPRVTSEGPPVEIEGRWPRAVVRHLRQQGWQAAHGFDAYEPRYGRVHAIGWNATTGRPKPGADPRGGGAYAWA